MQKQDLEKCVIAALEAHSGKATIVQVAKFIWKTYEKELKTSGDLFFTWQYDIRWAANRLRHAGRIKAVELSPKGFWELNK
ncbi:hypothetical protein GTGU_04396 [Trabulsiella guamensis ATCC 49490]|uniref:Restriction system protein Mrr-like N-terminal domain-containing protein n=1 Tax=Trabulsiella guamensis ATCC 49490 TaxID=1005994 RepID=A0A084ZMN1_9ENTR|nr:hypothetical protein [Trabulsiella guamensis]KFB98725.1 hypothetical protein GTGU_04396 [Trabulsiella guamensis ATCC 49490]